MARIMWMDLYRDLKERTELVLETKESKKALKDDRIDEVIAALEKIAGLQFGPLTMLDALGGKLEPRSVRALQEKCQKALATRDLFGEWENLRGMLKTLGPMAFMNPQLSPSS